MLVDVQGRAPRVEDAGDAWLARSPSPADRTEDGVVLEDPLGVFLAGGALGCSQGR